MKKINFFAILLVLTFTSLSAQTKWTFDQAHTDVMFSVTHLVISTVTGYFRNSDGSVVTNGNDFNNAKINFTIQTKSIDTDNKKRDKHLRSKDFFYAKKYPEIIFKSTSFKKVEGNNYKLTGNLTMRGITKPVVLNVQYNGMVKDPWGNLKAGFKITGSLNRFDFGLKWNALLEAGGAIVSKKVKLIINAELKKVS